METKGRRGTLLTLPLNLLSYWKAQLREPRDRLYRFVPIEPPDRPEVMVSDTSDAHSISLQIRQSS